MKTWLKGGLIGALLFLIPSILAQEVVGESMPSIFIYIIVYGLPIILTILIYLFIITFCIYFLRE